MPKVKASDILKEISSKSADKEFYTPVPENYGTGKTKYIVITGSVMSGVGKGIFTSSLANTLSWYGLKVSPIKFDGYLNYDAGTLNPFRHGEVFVLDDGTECDLDLGSYERFLDKDLSKANYMTAGKLFKTIIDKERAGLFLGRDVQFIPHVTGEIKKFARTLAVASDADLVMIEVGGTAGDIENSYFIEAMRELAYEEGKENVCFVNVTYIMQPNTLGEQKSKAAQLGIRTLMSLGIQPDIVVCRSDNKLTQSVKEKISVVANVPVERVVSSVNVDTIYDIPSYLHEHKVDKTVLGILGIEPPHSPEESFKQWQKLVNGMKKQEKKVTIGITGKYTNVHDSYLSILKALEHCSSALKTKINIKWIETTEIEEGKTTAEEALKGVDGVIVPGGFGKRGSEGKIKCVQYLRENKVPYLGICFGFQMAVIEFARNVCGIKDANSTELEPETKAPVISILPEQKKIEGLGGNMRLGGQDVEVKKDTLAYKLYGKERVRERFRHRYEVDPEYIKKLEEKGMVFSGKAPKYPIMQILELPGHPYFIGAQFHPCFTSRPLKPHPMFYGLVEACLKNK
ncbi:CTP synthase [Candidatus Woesearchaeota archaeon]|nr:CTP synthase [Candidatus Woesearchaeota archaeon]